MGACAFSRVHRSICGRTCFAFADLNKRGKTMRKREKIFQASPDSPELPDELLLCGSPSSLLLLLLLLCRGGGRVRGGAPPGPPRGRRGGGVLPPLPGRPRRRRILLAASAASASPAPHNSTFLSSLSFSRSLVRHKAQAALFLSPNQNPTTSLPCCRSSLSCFFIQNLLYVCHRRKQITKYRDLSLNSSSQIVFFFSLS